MLASLEPRVPVSLVRFGANQALESVFYPDGQDISPGHDWCLRTLACEVRGDRRPCAACFLQYQQRSGECLTQDLPNRNHLILIYTLTVFATGTLLGLAILEWQRRAGKRMRAPRAEPAEETR